VIVSGDSGYSENIRLYIDNPKHDSVIKEEEQENLRISGWSADLSVGESTGIEKIEVYLNGPRGMGKFLGQADYGYERQDVANALANANYTNSGYNLIFDARYLEPGTENTIYVYSYSIRGTYTLAILDIIMEGEAEDTNVIMSVEALLEESTVNISGWAISKDDAKNTGPRNTDIEYIDKKIVFVSNKNGNEDIFIIDIDGANLTQLTDNTARDVYPVSSPDGKKIAYTSEIGGYWQIVVMEADGSNKVQLTRDPFRSGYPTWSFDGRHIFYEVYRDGDWEIYRMNSDGSGKKRLTFNSDSYDWHPSAHPFQYQVLYESGPGGNEKLYLMDEDGSNKDRVSDNGMRMRTPTYSPDGSEIAFMGYEGNNHFIYLMDSDGENIKRLTGDISKCGHPEYSPDGEFIVFQGIVDGQEEIFIINSDGSNLKRLTNIPGNDWDADFLYQLP
jgi:TolB protein